MHCEVSSTIVLTVLNSAGSLDEFRELDVWLISYAHRARLA